MTGWSLSERFIFDGDAVAFDVFGQGPSLVLIHGTPFSSCVWRRIARELANSHEVFVFDLLGYGSSAKRDGQDVSLGVQNRLLESLLSLWSLERPRVMAHDFGGATALRAHILNGCDYARLLLIDPVAIRPWGSPLVQHVRAHEAAFAGLPSDIHAAMVAAYVRGAAYRPLSDAEVAPYVQPWLGPDGQPAFYRQIAQMDLRYTDEIEGRLREIRCPVAVLWGEDDGWIPVAQGQKLQRAIPGATLRAIPACGHLMQEDAPEAVVAEALRFFQ